MTNQLELVNGVLQPMSDIDQATYDALQAAYVAGVQSRLLSALAAYRYAVQTGGTTINGNKFLTDTDSQFALTGAFIAAQANSAMTINWKMADGTFVNLNASQIMQAWAAGMAFVQKCFDTEATLKANIANYTDTPTLLAAFDTAMAAS